MNKAVALFDFDDTIAKGDTVVKFLKYDLKKKPYNIVRYIPIGFNYLLHKCHLKSFEKTKSSLLYPLDYMSDEELKSFYHDYVIPSYYPHMVEELKKRKEEGCVVIVCTASVEAYMKYIDLPIDCLIGTKTKRKDNHETRMIEGENCKNSAKVKRIQDYLKSKDIEIDYDHSYGYSDSDHDIPMLSLVKNKIRVNKSTGQMEEFIPKQ